MRSQCSLFSFALFLLPALVYAEKLPVEIFAQPAAFAQMTLSWDGKYVAYTAEYEEEERVFFRNLDNPKEVLGVDVPKSNASFFGKIAGITWISPKRLLINSYAGYVAIDRDGKDYSLLTGYARIYGVNRKDDHYLMAGSVIRAYRTRDADHVLLNEYDQPSAVSRTGWIGLRTPNVLKLNTRSGTFMREMENPGNVVGWIADREGQVRIGLRLKDRKLAVLYRDNEKSEWRILSGLGEDPTATDVMGFNEDGKLLYVSCVSANGRRAVYLYDPIKDALGELVLSHEIYDISPINGASLIQTANGRLLGINYVTEAPHVLWLDPEFAAIQRVVNETLPKVSNRIIGITDDEKFMLVFSSSARNPGTYYFFDRKNNQLGKFVDVSPWVVPEKMADVFPLRLAARDGLRLHGYITVPPGREMKNLPLIVMPHGGPWARDHYGFDPLAQFLANRGYATLKINYRGSVGYGREFYEKGFRQVGTGMQADIEDAARWVISKGIADAQRIGIMGGSFGGYSTLMGLILTPDLYKCGINMAGVTDWARIIRHTADLHPDSYAFNVDRIGDPQKDAEMLHSISPVNLVDKIQAPLLIVHGRDDPTVPYDQARALIDALTKAGKRHESMVKYNEPHGINNYKNRIALYKRIEQFLAEHMPAGN